MTATLSQPQTAAKAPARKLRLLMLTHRLPYPPDRGDRIRSYHLLKILSQHFDLGVACTSEDPVWLQHHQLLRAMASRVVIQPISARYSKVRALGAVLTGKPVTPAWHYRPSLADSILQWHEEDPFDAVLTFCTGMIHYARLLTRPRPGPDGRPSAAGGTARNGADSQGASDRRAPRRRLAHILDLVDVDSMKWDSYARSSFPPASWVYAAEARRLRRIEAGQFDDFDAITVISPAEADAYRRAVGDHPGLTVVRNGVDVDYFHPLPDPNNHALVFVGVLNYRPNAEGIVWFAQHVMPLLRQRLPEARLMIVGRHPTPRVQALSQVPGVEVVGSVPDVRSYLGDASAVIAPLQIARGLQNKVLEGMACQRAVVCSPGAAQGIEATPGEHLLVADQPQEWADQLEKVLTDASLRGRLASAARQHVERVYSWVECLQPMIRLIQRAADQ